MSGGGRNISERRRGGRGGQGGPRGREGAEEPARAWVEYEVIRQGGRREKGRVKSRKSPFVHVL